MNKKIYFAAICCMAMLAGCQQAEEIVSPSEELVMSVEASIEDTIGSRYASNNVNGTPNSLKFDSGDNIGVFVGEKGVTKWTKSETGSWGTTPSPVYWPGKESAGYDFYAFYPYPTEASEFSKKDVPMPSLAGQTGTIASLSACDFMVATAHSAYNTYNGKVSFTGEKNCFKHVSSLVAITILKESDLVNSTVNYISFEAINLASSRTYSFENIQNPIKFTPTGVKSAIKSDELNLSMANETTNKTLYFILNSGINLSGVTFSIEYSTGGKNYIATKTGLGNGSFASGSRYNFNLNITDGVLAITGTDIQDWGAGTNMGDIIINTPIESPNDEND